MKRDSNTDIKKVYMCKTQAFVGKCDGMWDHLIIEENSRYDQSQIYK